jgi:hypothetical protein
MPVILLIGLRIGGAFVGSMGWYWALPGFLRRAADARTRDHIARTYGASLWELSLDQARAVYRWARAEHA